MSARAESRWDRHRALIIGAMTAAHFLLSVAGFLSMATATSSRFDGGGPSDATYLILKGTFDILSLPFVMPLLAIHIPDMGPWGWFIFLANSSVWGWAGWRIIRFWRSRAG